MIALFISIMHLLGIAAAIDAIISVRTSQGAVAWSVSLVTFPYVALPAYLLFGRSRFEGYLEEREKVANTMNNLSKQIIADAREYGLPPGVDMPIYTSLVKLGTLPAMRKNRLQLLINGNATFDSILKGISGAQSHVLVEFYTIKDDGLGGRLKDALIERARAGIKVYVVYDEVGSLGLPSTYVDALRNAGVQIHAFDTRKGSGNRFQLNFRNHRKIVVVDGKSAWIGGHNVGDDYLGLNPKIGPWRDTHSQVDGPAAIMAQAVIAMDWYWATNSLPEVDWSIHPVEDGDSTVMVYPTDPSGQYEGATMLFMQAITLSRKSLWIATPYFVPDEGIISALQIAALRGVDVRLIIADKSDNKLVDFAAWSYLPRLMEAGIKVYRYTGGFLHEKVFLVDDKDAGVGTINFDNRSFRLNFEIVLMATDIDFAREVREMLVNDMENSRQVLPEELDTKSFWFPLATGFARLMAPIL